MRWGVGEGSGGNIDFFVGVCFIGLFACWKVVSLGGGAGKRKLGDISWYGMF